MVHYLTLAVLLSLACFGGNIEIVCKKSGQGFVRGEGTYSDGDNVNLLAVAQPNWRFERWIINDAVSTNQALSINANTNINIEVVFVKDYRNNAFVGGTVSAWGFIDGRDYIDPQEVVPKDLLDVVSVSAGYFHSVAIKSDGTVIAWGNNSFGQTSIPSNLGSVKMISAGGYHSVALLHDGSIVSWGGRLNLTPPRNLGTVVSIAAGRDHTVALKTDGSVVAWGDSTVTNVGFNTIRQLKNIKSIAAGGSHCLALKSDGTVVGWGANDSGQTSVPVGLSNVVAIAAGENHSVALKIDGTVVGWGSNQYGQLFSLGMQTDIVGISAGCTNTILLKSNGTVVGGGYVSPPNLKGVVAVSAGRYHILGLKSNDLCVIGRDETSEIVVEEGETVDKSSNIINSIKIELFKDKTISDFNLNNRIYFKNAKVSDSGSFTLLAYGERGDSICYQLKIIVVPKGYPKIWVDEKMVYGIVSKGGAASVKITSSLVNSQILYTLDGSDPDFNSIRYFEPFTVDSTVIVKALVLSEDFIEKINSLPAIIQIVPSYKLIVNTSVGGRVEQEPFSDKYIQDEVISLKAIPKEGFRFLTWEGDLSGAFQERNVAMTRDKSVRAVFETIPRYSLNTAAQGGTVTGGGAYYDGASVNLEAIQAPGWEFLGWSGDYVGRESRFSWTVESAASFVANFGTIISNVSTGGGQIVFEPALPVYPYGSRVKIIPVPNPGCALAIWGGVGAGQPKSSWIFTVTNAAPKITALFQALASDKAVLTARSTFGGRVTQAAVDGIYAKGSEVTLVAVAEPGYEFLGWSGDTNATNNPVSLMLNSNKTIRAEFRRAGVASYPLALTVSGPGVVRRVPDLGAYELGNEVDLVAEPSVDSAFLGWRGGVTNSQKRIRLTINGPVTVDALFRPIHPVLTEVRGEGQVLLSPPDGKYIDGTDLALTAKPADGWGLVQWSGDLSTTSQEASLKVDAPKRVVAEFARLGTLTTKTVGSGSVSRTPDAVSYLPGTSVTLLATPAAGWKFLKWSGGAGGSNPQLAVVMGRAEAIVAEFGDGEAPVLTVEQPQSGATRDERFGLKGKCSDNLRLASLSWTWNGVPQGTVPMSDGVFDLGGLTLQPGTNQIVLEAKDVAGNSARVERVLVWTPLRSLAIRAATEVQEGQRLGFPITLDSPGDVAGLTFQMDYDPVWLTDPQWEWGGLVGQSVNTLNTATNGQIWATFSMPGQALPPGTQPIATVSFRARSVPEVREVDLKPSIRSVSGLQGNALSIGNAALAGTGRIKPRRLKADNNANQRLDIGDAVVVARLQVGLEEARAWDVGLNDLNNSGNLDNGDVVKALRAVVGLDPQPGPGSEGKRLAAAVGLAKVLVNTNDVMALELVDGPTATVGQPYRVAVRLNRLMGSLSGLSFAVKYPASLTLTDKQVGALVPGDALPFWNESSGQVSLAAIRSTAWPNATSVAAVLTFVPTAAFTGQAEWSLRLEQSEITGSGFDVRPVDPVSVVIQSSGSSVDNRPQITLQPPKADGSLGLEIRAPAGATIAVETTSDLNSWTETQRVTGQGTGLPVKVTLQADPNVQAKFWRVRVR